MWLHFLLTEVNFTFGLQTTILYVPVLYVRATVAEQGRYYATWDLCFVFWIRPLGQASHHRPPHAVFHVKRVASR